MRGLAATIVTCMFAASLTIVVGLGGLVAVVWIAKHL